MSASVYIIGYQRPELLACTLASVCGYNRGQWDIEVLDDGSTDPRVAALCTAYQSAGLIGRFVPMPHRGIGPLRRAMIDRFIASGSDQLVQVEGDMLIQPGGIAMLIDAWNGLRARGEHVHWLNTHNHDWCHKIVAIKQIGPYRIGIARSNSEPFWMSDRETLAGNLDALPANRPDLVPFLRRVGATVLFAPQIHAQHLGAGPQSILYPQFSWEKVTYRDNDGLRHDNGPLRQPFDFLTLDFPEIIREYPQSVARIYGALRERAPVALPEFPK